MKWIFYGFIATGLILFANNLMLELTGVKVMAEIVGASEEEVTWYKGGNQLLVHPVYKFQDENNETVIVNTSKRSYYNLSNNFVDSVLIIYPKGNILSASTYNAFNLLCSLCFLLYLVV